MDIVSGNSPMDAPGKEPLTSKDLADRWASGASSRGKYNFNFAVKFIFYANRQCHEKPKARSKFIASRH